MQARPTAALLLTCLLACCMPVVDGREFAPLDKATIASISAEMDKAKIADGKPVDDTGAGDKVASSDPAATDAKAPPADRRLPQVDTFRPTLKPVGGAIKGDPTEIQSNPRARSAIMRVAQRTEVPA